MNHRLHRLAGAYLQWHPEVHDAIGVNLTDEHARIRAEAETGARVVAASVPLLLRVAQFLWQRTGAPSCVIQFNSLYDLTPELDALREEGGVREVARNTDAGTSAVLEVTAAAPLERLVRQFWVDSEFFLVAYFDAVDVDISTYRSPRSSGEATVVGPEVAALLTMGINIDECIVVTRRAPAVDWLQELEQAVGGDPA